MKTLKKSVPQPMLIAIVATVTLLLTSLITLPLMAQESETTSNVETVASETDDNAEVSVTETE